MTETVLKLAIRSYKRSTHKNLVIKTVKTPGAIETEQKPGSLIETMKTPGAIETEQKPGSLIETMKILGTRNGAETW